MIEVCACTVSWSMGRLCSNSIAFLRNVCLSIRVKPGNVGHQANSDSDLVCVFYFNYWYKKVNLANSKNPDERAHLDLHCLQMNVRKYLMSEFT